MALSILYWYECYVVMNFDSFWCSDYDPLLVSSHEQLLQLLLLPVYRLWYLHWRKGGGMELLNAVFWVMLIFSCSTHLPLLKAIFILSGGRRILYLCIIYYLFIFSGGRRILYLFIIYYLFIYLFSQVAGGYSAPSAGAPSSSLWPGFSPVSGSKPWFM